MLCWCVVTREEKIQWWICMQRAIKRYLLDLIRLSVCANTQCRSDWIKIDGIDLRLPFHQEILLVISLVIDKGFFETANLRILLSLRNWKKFSGNLYSILGFRLRFCDVRSRFSAAVIELKISSKTLPLSWRLCGWMDPEIDWLGSPRNRG